MQLKAAYKLINSVCSIDFFNSKALGSWQRINDHVQGRQGRSTPYIGDGLLLGWWPSLLYGNNGSLDPSTYVRIISCLVLQHKPEIILIVIHRQAWSVKHVATRALWLHDTHTPHASQAYLYLSQYILYMLYIYTYKNHIQYIFKKQMSK